MKQGQPAVSVVIATRNRRGLLSEAIATVVDQTLSDWELIVVDDASEDDTAELLASIDDSRVRSLRQPAHGERSKARNLGLAEARGEFVMFLDDDDLLRPAALASLSAALASRLCANRRRLLGQLRPEPVPHLRHSPDRRLRSRAHSMRGPRAMAAGRPGAVRCVCCPRWLWSTACTPASVRRRTWTPSGTPSWARFIDSLPSRERRQALRIRAAAVLAAESAQARSGRRFGAGLRLQCKALCAAPWLIVSPLTARPFWWGLKKCLLRSTAP